MKYLLKIPGSQGMCKKDSAEGILKRSDFSLSTSYILKTLHNPTHHHKAGLFGSDRREGAVFS
jgi:hypothetical protein